MLALSPTSCAKARAVVRDILAGLKQVPEPLKGMQIPWDHSVSCPIPTAWAGAMQQGGCWEKGSFIGLFIACKVPGEHRINSNLYI